MVENQRTWSPDWVGRIDNAIRSLGFVSLTEFLASMPSQPYGEIAKRLGQIAPIQIIAVQFLEAKSARRVREAAKDSLCRNLVEQLPEGWGVGANAEWQTARALSSWSSEIQVTGECEELKSTLLAVAKALREMPPPQGWIPKGPDDSIIESIFDSRWPIGS
jgi:hypothetical protein